jgi:hypothetical protein
MRAKKKRGSKSERAALRVSREEEEQKRVGPTLSISKRKGQVSGGRQVQILRPGSGPYVDRAPSLVSLLFSRPASRGWMIWGNSRGEEGEEGVRSEV